MSQFLLIDHSLKGIGGHHVEYALHVGRAAETAGFRVLVATHRRFRAADAFPSHWPVLPVFPFTTYSDYTIYDSRALRTADWLAARNAGAGLAHLYRLCRERIRDLGYHLGRRRRIRGFCRGMTKLFTQVRLSAGDQVFVPTLSELDLLGLGEFLSVTPQTSVADWRLQFHFQIFDGREPGYAAQAHRLAAMQSVFRQAWPNLQRHRIRCYNTTAQLTDQYDRLGVTKFHTLPYPVNPAFHEPRPAAARQDAPRPLRLVCAGAIRAEKGSRELTEVARELWLDLLRSERLQLVVQSNKPGFRLPLPDDGPRDAVVYAPHPLSVDGYVDLMRQADMGLLLYDSERYYARCSGVLVELLSLGVPVIVSSGCWMAEQLAAAQFTHVERAVRELSPVANYRLARADWRDSTSASIDHTADGSQRWTLRDPDVGAQCRWPVAAPADLLVVTWKWAPPSQPGTYMRLELTQLDADGVTLTHPSQIIGQRSDTQSEPAGRERVSALFRLDSNARTVELLWRNAYGKSPVAVSDFELHGLSTAGHPSGSYPLGAVGLIAADAGQVGRLVREMLVHWPHYRQTAAEFAPKWQAFHNASRIVTELTGRRVSHQDGADSRAA